MASETATPAAEPGNGLERSRKYKIARFFNIWSLIIFFAWEGAVQGMMVGGYLPDFTFWQYGTFLGFAFLALIWSGTGISYGLLNVAQKVLPGYFLMKANGK